MRRNEDPDRLAEALLGGERAALARTITLVESTREADRRKAAAVLDRIAGAAPPSVRIGVSGVPGAGKSTLLDAFGTLLTAKGRRVAVLAIDPSSVRTGGSILGDKTRMRRLSGDRDAFVRPSPSSGTLGGVAARTRETMQLCEAAGFDTILVETMGVGQAEIRVAGMVDIVLLVMIAGGGDELQGIKKGILEIADLVAINKADGDNLRRARSAASQMRAALDILTPRSADWKVPVETVSALEETGLDALWRQIERFRRIHTGNGAWDEKRRTQRIDWLHGSIEEALRRRLIAGQGWADAIAAGEEAVAGSRRAPSALAEELLDRFVPLHDERPA